MLITLLAIGIVAFLAYANGANDNFKGVATLLGSGTTDFESTRRLATVTTLLGSIAALFLAHGLIAKFSGKGLVPDDVMSLKSFCLAVSLASALTVILATRFGFPISTTHALVGSLIGAGWFASAEGVNLSKLGATFFLPLLVSPVLSLALAVVLYPVFRRTRSTLKIKKETCVCVGKEVLGVVPANMTAEGAIAHYTSTLTVPTIRVGTKATCEVRYRGEVLGVSATSVVTALHFLSAGTVCFSRSLNDTPKIAALLLTSAAFPVPWAIAIVGTAMIVGGFINGKKVAYTMSKKITEMDPGQGLAANLSTSFMVIFASKLGLPVSTTHVSCGSLFGIGTLTGKANWKSIASILTAWVTTLPVSAALGMGLFLLFKGWVQ